MWKYIATFILFVLVSWVAPTISEEKSTSTNKDATQHLYFDPSQGRVVIYHKPEWDATQEAPVSVPIPTGRSTGGFPFQQSPTRNTMPINKAGVNKFLSPFLKSSNSSATNTGTERQFFGIANHLSNGSMVPPSGNGTNQFFGIANLYFGRESCNATCPKCPVIPVLGPATITVTATTCATIDTLNSCSVASLAPKGSVFVLFLTTTAGSGVVGIVPQAPNTKVSVTCYNIPSGITVKTQTGALTANTAKEEIGYAQLLVYGSATAPNVAAACEWKSIP